MAHRPVNIVIRHGQLEAELYTPYNVEFVTSLKFMLAKTARRWDGSKWLIKLDTLPTVVRLVRLYYPQLEFEYASVEEN